MRRKSISVIDHLKCGPLFQGRNVLAQHWNILTYSTLAPCSESSWGHSGFPSHIHLIFVLLSRLNFQGFFHLSHHSAPCPFPSLSLHSVPPALPFPLVHHKKQALYVSTQWPNEGVWVQTEAQRGKIKKTTRQKRGEIGRKAWHQEGFSLVKQEVWETKGQKEELFQSVTPLSHCFHCVLAVMFAFMFAINKLQRIDVLCWLNEGIWEFSLALMIHLTVVAICCERAPRRCPGDDKLWNTPPSCLQTVRK